MLRFFPFSRPSDPEEGTIFPRFLLIRTGFYPVLLAVALKRTLCNSAFYWPGWDSTPSYTPWPIPMPSSSFQSALSDRATQHLYPCLIPLTLRITATVSPVQATSGHESTQGSMPLLQVPLPPCINYRGHTVSCYKRQTHLLVREDVPWRTKL